MKKILVLTFLASLFIVSSCGSDSQSSAPASAPEVVPVPEMK